MLVKFFITPQQVLNAPDPGLSLCAQGSNYQTGSAPQIGSLHLRPMQPGNTPDPGDTVRYLDIRAHGSHRFR